MSIATYSIGDAAIAAQAGAPAVVKKPPPRRTIVVQPDTTQSPEPR
ncbi:MAG: hypothetical protein H0V46_04665 [Sphingomonas sp.]|nr:hypothetical protein [Sphingomonas sp.]